jgi:hypothetical protein
MIETSVRYERPDEGERVKDRGDGDGDRHQHRGQRAKHEQQDHERADPTDQRFQQNARTATRAMLARFPERVTTRNVDGDAGRQAARCRGTHLRRAALGVEPGGARRIHLAEGRVPVARDVHETAGREVRARARAVHRGGGPLHCPLDGLALGRVSACVEDDDARRACADAECLQRPLARLVGRLAGDRHALIPARRHLPRGKAAEDSKDDPCDDHRPAVSDGQVREAGKHRNLLFVAVGIDHVGSIRGHARPDNRSQGYRRATKVVLAIDFGRLFNRGNAL